MKNFKNMNNFLRNARVILLCGLLFSVCQGSESSVVEFEFVAAFNLYDDSGETPIPTHPVYFTGPSGSWTTKNSDWTHDPDHYARARKTTPCMVTDGVPIVVACKYDRASDFGFDSGGGWVKVIPPAWATKIYLGSNLTPNYFKTPDNLWHYSFDSLYWIDPPDGTTDVWIPIDYNPQGFVPGDNTQTFTIRGEESCQSCVSCGSNQPGLQSPPSLNRGTSGSPSISANMPFGSECCRDSSKPTNITWRPSGLPTATNPQSFYVSSYELSAGTAYRFPADLDQALQQLKVGESLGVLVSGANSLKWRVYDATGIGTPNVAGEYPLTKGDGSPLTLLDEVSITQESADSVLYERRKSGVLTGQFRITRDVAQNSWQSENLLAGSREKLIVSASGTGWITGSERYEKNSGGTWKLVQTRATTTATFNGQEVVIAESEGGETVATHDYYPDARRKWTVNGDGSWVFYHYSSVVEYTVYTPYGDTPFPGGGWDPSSIAASFTGIRRESFTESGSTSKVGGISVGWRSTSTSMNGNYASTVENSGPAGTTTTTSTSVSPNLPQPFRSRTLLDDDGHGIITLHEFTRGTIDENGFTPAANGNDVMEIITRGASAGEVPDIQYYDSGTVTIDPIVIGAKFENVATREVRVYDSKGRTVCTATQILDGSEYAVATQTVRTYSSLPDDEGEVITEALDGRVVSTMSSLSDGTWEQSVDEAGAVRTTESDLLGRVTTETLPGFNGSTITRTHAYDGLITTITTSGGGLSLSTSETRDLRGRVVSSSNEINSITTYPRLDGGRTTRVSRLGSVIEETTHYLDGRFKQRSGIGVVREFASYTIDGSGNEVTKRSSGPPILDGHGARWTETTTDQKGRTILVRHPGPPTATGSRQDDIIESYFYDPNTGKLNRISSSARPGVYQLMDENLLGTWSASGTATHTGPLVANSNDRFSSSAKTYEKRGDHFWEITTRSTYVQGATPVVTTSAVCLWSGEGGASEFTDAANITTTQTTTYDPAHETVVMSSGNSLQGTTTETTINGFLTSRSIPDAARNEAFFYDGLGREIRHTDVRNASTHTNFNNLGQVEKVVDHLGQSVTYTYYPANHESAGRVHTQTDAAGKVTETSFDTLGRVFKITGSASYPVDYSYDDFGDRETLTTYGTQTAVTTWVHDHPTGLLLEKKYHGQTTGVKYSYYGDGRLESRTWRRGVKTTYHYDNPSNAFGDLDAIDYPAGTPDVSFSNFDRVGRPGTVTEGSNVTTLTYDALTGETSTTYAASHGILPGLSVVMKSPNSGRPGGYTLNQGSTPLEDVAYGYDTLGRFGGLTSGGHEVAYQYYSGTNTVWKTTHTVAGAGTPRIETRAVDLAGRTTGVATTVPNGAARRIAASAGYMVNVRGLREKLTREDGTSWNYGYNDRSEVTSGVKKLANGDLASGLQFGYQFDGIGNRQWAKSGGNSSGQNQRTVNYTPNALNQYEEITTPGSFDVLVRSQDAVGVNVNGSSVFVTTQGDFHRAEATATNTNGAWVDLEITSPVGQNSLTGHRWLQPAVFSPGYDEGGELKNQDKDGNLTNDGRWTYEWDAESRLVAMTTTQAAADLGVPKRKLEFSYDWQSRRIRKKVTSTTSATIATANWTLAISDERFVYNGWNQLAVFDASGSTLTARETNLWGLDLSGTHQGAGGVSGLLAVSTVSTQSVCYPAIDGNGNIVAWTASNGDTLLHIDYDPFGNVVTKEGVAGFEAPAWGFSTKYQDKESGLLYYGYRFYDPVNGRWPSRDPIEEDGGLNLYGFVGNDAVNKNDLLGNVIATKEGKNYKDSVVKALTMFTGGELEWIKKENNITVNGVVAGDWYVLCAKINGAGALWSDLKEGIDDDVNRVLSTTDFNGKTVLNDNASGQTRGNPRRIEISLDVEVNMALIDEVRDSNGHVIWKIGSKTGRPKWKKQMVGFDVNLWHELVGHSIKQLEHPERPENAHVILNFSGKVARINNNYPRSPDPAVGYENKVRSLRGLLPRRPEYWDYYDARRATGQRYYSVSGQLPDYN
jgi:RHS repeat-associated protein